MLCLTLCTAAATAMDSSVPEGEEGGDAEEEWDRPPQGFQEDE